MERWDNSCFWARSNGQRRVEEHATAHRKADTDQLDRFRWLSSPTAPRPGCLGPPIERNIKTSVALNGNFPNLLLNRATDIHNSESQVLDLGGSVRFSL